MTAAASWQERNGAHHARAAAACNCAGGRLDGGLRATRAGNQRWFRPEPSSPRKCSALPVFLRQPSRGWRGRRARWVREAGTRGPLALLGGP